MKSFTGRFEHDVNLDVVPVLSEGRAFRALRVGADIKPNDYGRTPPKGELIIHPIVQGPHPVWELAWGFTFPATGDTQTRLFAVSARDGRILQAPKSIDEGGVNLTIEAIEQRTWHDDGLCKASTSNDSTRPVRLDTVVKGLPITVHASVVTGDVQKYYVGGIDIPAVVETSMSYSLTVPDKNGTVEQLAAAAFLAQQRCIEYFAEEFVNAGTPWLGPSGENNRLDVYMVERYPNKPTKVLDTIAFYQGAIYYPSHLNYGASIDRACHEFAHGMWQTLTTEPSDGESQALNEGFSDIMGSAAERHFRPSDPASTWCHGGDTTGNITCGRNLALPHLSKDGSCEILPWYTQCPADYRTQDYCTTCPPQDGSPPDWCCDEHHNSTVLSHWFYLISDGGEGKNGLSCGYLIAPLSINALESIKIAVKIVFEAAKHYNPLNLGYEGFADATLDAASSLYPNNLPIRDTIAAAWYAVNVKQENFMDPALADVNPPRWSKKVSPWVSFRWPVHYQETAWDFQLASGPFSSPTSVLFQHRVTDPNPGKTAGFSLALPPNDSRTFYWRVRRAWGLPDDTWDDCYPINAFDGTGEIGLIQDLQITDDKTADGKFRPGSVNASWTGVAGAQKYKVRLSKSDFDKDCNSPDPVSDTFAPTTESAPTTASIKDIEPEEHYFLAVQPIGPDDLTNTPSLGKCASLQFDTAPLRAPEPKSPQDNAVSDYHGNPIELSWAGPPDADAAAEYRVTFYPQDYAGNCMLQSPIVRTVQTKSTLDDISPRSVAGYCWSVAAVAKNGKESPPSTLRRYRYFHKLLTPLSPGSLDGPGVLPGDSYGQPVPFTWAQDPEAWGYQLRIFPYHYFDFSLPDPDNCPRCVTVPGGSTTSTTVNCLPSSGGGGLVGVCDKLASDGRNCWQVWPRHGDPADPTAPQTLLQTAFAGGWTKCYTSGPATPTIHFDSGQQPQEGFEPGTAPITGHIEFPYVPDGQFDVKLEESETGPQNAGCSVHLPDKAQQCAEGITQGSEYRDIHNCRVQFTADTCRGWTYHLRVRTWNSPTHPPDTISLPVHDLDFAIKISSCGQRDEKCCAFDNSYCFDTASECDSGFCRRCGHEGELACKRMQPPCQQLNLAVGPDGRCHPCGGQDKICCTAADWPQCSTGNECRNGVCSKPESTCIASGKTCDGKTPCCGGECSQNYTGGTATCDKPCGGLAQQCCLGGTGAICSDNLACRVWTDPYSGYKLSSCNPQYCGMDTQFCCAFPNAMGDSLVWSCPFSGQQCNNDPSGPRCTN